MENNKVNILIVTPSFPSQTNSSIAGKFVLTEAKAYALNGAKVKVLTPFYPDVPVYEKYGENIEVYRFKYFFIDSFQTLINPFLPSYRKKPLSSYLLLPFFVLSFVFSIIRHARSVDIIHCQWTATAFLSFPAKWLWNKKVLVTARGSDLRLIPVWLNKWIFKNVDASAEFNRPSGRHIELLRLYKSNYLLLPLIVDTVDENNNVPSDLIEKVDFKNDFVILYLGRLNNDKIKLFHLPILQLLDAFSEVLKKHKRIKLIYVGSGDLEEELSEKINSLHLTNNVFLLGSKENPVVYIKHSNLAVGGLSLNAVSQEFTMCERTQVLVNDHEYNEGTHWKDKKNCLFVNKYDIKSLINVLEYAYKNQEEIKQMGKQAKMDCSQYIVDEKLGGSIYLEKFQKLINKHE